MAKSYYAILGISSSAKADEIKAAYRRLTKEIYPDNYSEKQSTDIDNISLVRSFHTYAPSFDEIFDWLWNNFSTFNYPKSGSVQNLTIEVPLSNEQALSGGNVRVMVPVRAICKTCRGYGNVGPYECTHCAGEGAITGEVPILIAFQPGLKRNQAVMIPLDRYGIRNLHLTVLFCPTDIY